jgi:hypothetical protein
MQLITVIFNPSFNLDYQYISRIERGLITPTVFWMKNLCKALEITAASFMDEFDHVE